jgi:hypothetical protein
MLLRVGKITKQSQTTDYSIFPRSYIFRCSDGASGQHTWRQKCTNGFVKRAELLCSSMASVPLLRSSESNLVFFRLRFAPYSLLTPTLSPDYS